jgi:outer membrane protein assembly factor BamB
MLNIKTNRCVGGGWEILAIDPETNLEVWSLDVYRNLLGTSVVVYLHDENGMVHRSFNGNRLREHLPECVQNFLNLISDGVCVADA